MYFLRMYVRRSWKYWRQPDSIPYFRWILKDISKNSTLHSDFQLHTRNTRFAATLPVAASIFPVIVIIHIIIAHFISRFPVQHTHIYAPDALAIATLVIGFRTKLKSSLFWCSTASRISFALNHLLGHPPPLTSWGMIVLRISSVLFMNRGRQQNWMLSKLELATFYTIITVFVLLQRDVKVLEAFVDWKNQLHHLIVVRQG